MDRPSALNKVTEMLEAQGIDVADIGEETKLVDDLEMDSLDFVELMMAMEEFIGWEIPDSAAKKFVTVGDVVGYLQEHVEVLESNE